MSYKEHQLWAKSLSYGGTRAASSIKYIVLHYTGNKTDTARANANYFGASGGNSRKAGAHYFVDESNVYQSIPEKRIAWSVGGSKYSDCAQTGGGKYYGKVTNTNSISIEMCSKNGAIAQATVENAATLTKELMKKYDIAADHVVRHFDVTGKPCPGWSGWIGSNQLKWLAFKRLLTNTKTKSDTSPTYTVGKTYRTQTQLKIRTSPAKGSSARQFDTLSSYTKTQCVAGKSDATLLSGVKITCKAVETGEDGSTYVKSPSGWLLAWNSKTKCVNIK